VPFAVRGAVLLINAAGQHGAVTDLDDDDDDDDDRGY
jgi:hypothetical protein